MKLPLAAFAILLGAGVAACGKRESGPSIAAASGSVAEVASGATSAWTGILAEYHARFDKPGKSVTDLKVALTASGALDVNAGTHDQDLRHILYRDADTARGTYIVRTAIDQLSAPEHPEALGILIGGQDLAGPGQQYGYFIVRGDGQYSVKRRLRDSAFTVIPFTASPNVPKMDANRHAHYALTARVDADSVRFLVADKPVAAVPRTSIPTDGVVGFRINHGLHVVLTPIAISH